MIHSLHGTNAAHGGALLKLHTGSDNFVRPSIGSWVSYGLGTEKRNLPAFVTICPTLAHGGINNWGAAFLPAVYQGTPLGNASVPSDQARVRYIANAADPATCSAAARPAGGSEPRASDPHARPTRRSKARIDSFELAFRMQNELPRGRGSFGRNPRDAQALRHRRPGRRPTSAGVPHGPAVCRSRRAVHPGHPQRQQVQWDQHGDLKDGHEKNAREVDRPIAGLLPI